MGETTLAAVLFDMDGTIIDSEPYWIEAENELVEEFGGTWTQEQAYSIVGSGLWPSARALQRAGVDLSEDDIVHRLSERVLERIEHTVPWRPGSRELIADLVRAGVPRALVTMSLRSNAVAINKAISRLLGAEVFDVIVSGDDVTEPKPHPEAYLSAADQLGVTIGHTVALEDSAFGATSAYTAGAVTIGVPLHVDIPSTTVHAIWDTIEGKRLADLEREFARHRGSASV